MIHRITFLFPIKTELFNHIKKSILTPNMLQNTNNEILGVGTFGKKGDTSSS
jgi:hypothetical protein